MRRLLGILLVLALLFPTSAHALSVQHQRDAITQVCGSAGGTIVYMGINWSSFWRVFCYGASDLRQQTWYGSDYSMNDAISSLYVWSSSSATLTVKFCRDVQYGPPCRWYANGSGDLDLRQRDLNDAISSLKVYRTL